VVDDVPVPPLCVDPHKRIFNVIPWWEIGRGRGGGGGGIYIEKKTERK
jgi:hypothetical protein